MYTVTAKRGSETVSFITAAGLYRWALDQRVFRHGVGGVPYPKRFDDNYLGHEDGNAGTDYHLIDSFTGWKITGEHLSAMRRARARYCEIVHYLSEVEPEWREERTVNYADNSTERYEINKYGQRRSVMLVAPHGDACY